MLEDVRAKKRRLNPARGQRRNFGNLMWRDRRADQWRMSSMIVTARCDHCHRAVVLDTIRILVDALVQLRRSTQRERPKKRYGDDRRDKSAPVII